MNKMNKLFIAAFIAILVFLSCKSKVKPGANSVNPGTSAPEITIDAADNNAYTTVFNKLKDKVWETLKNASALKSSDYVNKLKSKTFISRFPDGTWIALGVRSDGHNVSVSTGQSPSEAVAGASKDDNWDTRKLFFSVKGSFNDTVAFSWVARAGTQAGDASIFKKFTGFTWVGRNDFDKEVSITTEYTNIFGSNYQINDKSGSKALSAEEYASLSDLNAVNWVMNKMPVDETGKESPNGKRKAWMWDTTKSPERISGVGVIINPNFTRFGYVPSKATSDDYGYYPSYAGTKALEATGDDANLILLNHITGSTVNDITGAGFNNNSSFYKNSAPLGKAIFTRNFSGGYALYMATVVGYNVTLTEMKGSDIIQDSDLVGVVDKSKWTNATFQVLVMEFPTTSFADAKYDGWTKGTDAPLDLLSDKTSDQIPSIGSWTNLGGSTAEATRKVYFINTPISK